MRHHVHVRLLGGFAVKVDEQPLPLAAPRLQTLLAYMALHALEPQPRRRLAFALWPDSTDAQAQTNLRTLLHRLQAALSHAPDVLAITPYTVGWAPDCVCTSDVAAFDLALRTVSAPHHDTAQVVAALEQAITAYSGDLLPDSYDEWLLPERERLRQQFLAALQRIADLLAQQQAYDRAIPFAQQLVQHDQLNEDAVLQLMRLHSAHGDSASALRVYQQCERVLRNELAAAPGAALQALAQQVRGSVAASPAPVTLIGRTREWQQLQRLWGATTAGEATLVLLSGEAGIGKTRLAEEWRTWVQQHGAATATARCYAAAGDLAYAPVVAWLRTETLQPLLAQLDAATLSELARLLPELLTGPRAVPRPEPLAENWQRRRLFEALVQAFGLFACPLLLLLDDLQWCDGETLAWLHYLLRAVHSAPLVVLGTLRSEELDEAHPLLPLLAALRSEKRVVEHAIGPLSHTETTALAQQTARRALSPAQGHWIYAETEGNALFVVETVRASLDTDTPLPRGVHAVLARRLQQVSLQSAVLLRMAAVIGRSFTLAVLSQATDVDEATLVDGIEELCRRQIVRDLGGATYDFTHDKLRTTAYAALSSARRRLLHRRVAEALIALHAHDLDPVSGQVAAHYERAGLMAQAVTQYQRAATAAQGVFANDEASTLLQRAIALCSRTDANILAALYEHLGDILTLTGRQADAVEAYHQASATEQLPALSHARLLRKIAAVYTVQQRYPEAQQAAASAEQALGTAPAETDSSWWQEWVQLQIDQMMLYYWQSQPDRIAALVEKVRPVITRHGTSAQRGGFFKGLVLLHFRTDHYVITDTTLAYARQSLAAQLEAGVSSDLAFVTFNLGFTLLWRGELAEALAQLQAALALAERIGDVTTQSRCLTYLTVLERKRGNLAGVRALLERSIAVASAGQMAEYVGAAQGNAAWLAWREHDYAEAYGVASAAVAHWQALSITYAFKWLAHWPLLALALRRHDLPTALEHARCLLDPTQMRQPAPLEALLEQALQCAPNNADAAHAALAATLASAQQQGFL